MSTESTKKLTSKPNYVMLDDQENFLYTVDLFAVLSKNLPTAEGGEIKMAKTKKTVTVEKTNKKGVISRITKTTTRTTAGKVAIGATIAGGALLILSMMSDQER